MNPKPGDVSSNASPLPGTAEELLPLVYEELRSMAAKRMAGESPGARGMDEAWRWAV